MGRDCHDHELEIAAAGRGDLPEAVADHLASCPGCAALRASALAMARAEAEGPPSIAPAGARALARQALAAEARPRRALWVWPLLSASASAAALIVYFGLASPSAEAAPGRSGLEARTTLTALPDASAPSLPEGLAAISDLVASGAEETP